VEGRSGASKERQVQAVVNKKPLNPDESPMAFCGAYMRTMREQAGQTLDELALRVFQGSAYLSQIERAERRLQPGLGAQLDREWKMKDNFFENLAKAIRKAAGHADYFADAADQELHAESILAYEPALIPGLLQTEAYARAIIEAADPFRSEEERHKLLAARLERVKLLERPDATRPDYWAVVPEWAIRANYGGPGTMRGQLLHLATVIREKRAVVQVFPQDATVPPALWHLIELMDFADAPPLVYFEGAHSGQLIDERSIVRRYRRAYDAVRAAALSPEASLELIESAAKDIRTP
jgi:transcriptional regulator with XRE-family HTH domain